MTTPKPQDVPEAPAVIQHDHVQGRHLDKAGERKGWSRLPVYERKHRLGQLACRELCGDNENSPETIAEVGRALCRFAAARAFDEGWMICTASWPSGSDLNWVRVVGCPGSFVDHQRATRDFWRRVEQAMGVNDWMICRRVCGENYDVAETVTAISPNYKFSTLARFREALDALIVGMDRARNVSRGK